jgi:hypothetical protein
MAATHLTLEEAAQHLSISPEEFKKKLKIDPAFKTLVPIRDGSTLRFKAAAIEELGRQLGAASDPGLPLAPLEAAPLLDSDDFKVDASDAKKEAKPPKAPDSSGELLNLTSSSDDDIFTLSPEDSKSEKKPSKPGSDSDVRLESGKGKKAKKADGSDESVVPTEELSIDFNGPGSAVIKGGSSAKLSAPKSSGKIPKPDSGKGLAKPGGASDSSEFELSLDADSDDFELKLNTDASDEVDLGEMPKDTAGSGRRGTGESGINLRVPADSGISLEKSKAKGKEAKEGKDSGAKAKPHSAAEAAESSGSDVDFELTLDSSAAASGLKLDKLKPGKGLPEPDSDSEFELTLDDSSDSGLEAAVSDSVDAEKRDIFETDFEIPPMDESGSEAVALDPDSDMEKSDSDIVEMSDSDVAVDDSSASEVVLIDDEEEGAPKAKAKKKTATKKGDETEGDVDLADVDLADDEEDGSASKALKGAKGRRGDEEEEEEELAVPAGAGAYRPVPWGVLPALFLLPTLLITCLGGLLAFELLQTMWGYSQPRKPAAPLVHAIAKNLDMELKDQ